MSSRALLTRDRDNTVVSATVGPVVDDNNNPVGYYALQVIIRRAGEQQERTQFFSYQEDAFHTCQDGMYTLITERGFQLTMEETKEDPKPVRKEWDENEVLVGIVLDTYA